MFERTIEMRFLNATKGAVRYEEVRDGVPVKGDSAVIGTLYVRKAQLDESTPENLVLTIRGA